MAKVLVVKDLSVPIDAELLRNNIHEEITLNSMPKGEGIAIFDADKEPDWSWPDTVIKVGTVETGRHHVDITIGKNEDVEGAILDYMQTISDSDIAD